MSKKIKVIFLSFISVLCLCSFASAQEKVSVSFAEDKVHIGDIVDFKIVVELPKDSYISARQKFAFDNFEIFSSDINHITSQPNVYELTFKVAGYKNGILKMNPITVFYINPDGTNNLFFTPTAQIEILSIVPKSPSMNIQDIKAPKKLHMKPIFIVLIILLVLLLTAISKFLIKDIKEKIRKSKEVVLDPQTASILALDDLYKSNLKNENIRIFYYRMSEILRNYVSQKHQFDAMEMTTTEFLNSIKQYLPEDIKINEFKIYLTAFNLARYAGFKPSDKENEDNFKYTKNLLEKL